jgi:hypothetical protein
MAVEERALALIEKWEAGTYYGGAVQKKAALQVAIVEALREQDRDTRHACAESVIKLAHTVSQCSTVEYCKGFNSAVNSAHDTCMNVKAV